MTNSKKADLSTTNQPSQRNNAVSDSQRDKIHVRLYEDDIYWLASLKLNASTQLVYLYLRQNNPYTSAHGFVIASDYREVVVEDLAEKLQVSAWTVDRALKKLEQLKIIHTQIEKAKYVAFPRPVEKVEVVIFKKAKLLQEKQGCSELEQGCSELEQGCSELEQGCSDHSLKPLQDKGLKISHIDHIDHIDQTDQKLERSGLEKDPEYLAWINRKIDRFPQEPAFREQVEAAEAAKPINQRAFLKWQQKREEAKFSAHSQQAPKIENEEIDNSLETQIKRARAKWMANPRARPEIRAWAELEGIPMDESGPCIAIEGGEA